MAVHSPAERPRRVTLMTNNLVVGGAEAQLVRLARSLVDRGDAVSVITLLPCDTYVDELNALGVEVYELPSGPLRSVAYFKQARRELRRLRPDVVISFLYQSNVVARVAGRLAGVPVVISSIRAEHFGGRGRELVVRLTDRLATITTTNSAVASASLVARGVTPAGRLVVVPNGLDVDAFKQEFAYRETTRLRLRAELGIDPAAFVWLAAGRLVDQKDFSTLLQALALHATVFEEARLVIAGDGPLESTLRAEAATLGVANLVQFVGILGALWFGRVAQGRGAYHVILGGLFVWLLVVVAGWLTPDDNLPLFLLLAVGIGIVLGGTQALSRSFFSLLIPRGREGEYFALYNACERGTSWFGTLLFGVVFQVTGSYRPAIVSLIVFFVLGAFFLLRLDPRRGIEEAGNRLPAVV